MKSRDRNDFLAVVQLLLTGGVFFQMQGIPPQEYNPKQNCEVPEYFGMCDPYVPGVIVSGQDKQPFRVISTWSMGPAEKAGVCPGDEYPSAAFYAGLHPGDSILAVNGHSIEEVTREQLRSMLSPRKDSEIKFAVSRLGRRLTFRVKPETYERTLARIDRKLTNLGPVPRKCPDPKTEHGP